MDEIRINVPENVCAVLDRLTQAGYEAFVVGARGRSRSCFGARWIRVSNTGP